MAFDIRMVDLLSRGTCENESQAQSCIEEEVGNNQNHNDEMGWTPTIVRKENEFYLVKQNKFDRKHSRAVQYLSNIFVLQQFISVF